MENRQADSLVVATGFDTSCHYTQNLCLQFRGKPLFILGSRTVTLNIGLNFHADPNSSYSYKYPKINDYVSLNDEFWVRQEWGSANGTIFFSADRKGRIFNLRGNWLLKTDTTEEAIRKAVRALSKQNFPCLLAKLPLACEQKAIVHGPQFDEVFKLVPPDSSRSFPYYSLDYSVEFLPKKQ